MYNVLDNEQILGPELVDTQDKRQGDIQGDAAKISKGGSALLIRFLSSLSYRSALLKG